jgi:hypothetical protein
MNQEIVFAHANYSGIVFSSIHMLWSSLQRRVLIANCFLACRSARDPQRISTNDCERSIFAGLFSCNSGLYRDRLNQADALFIQVARKIICLGQDVVANQKVYAKLG